MGEIYSGGDYNAAMRKINKTNRESRAITSQAFCDALTNKLESFCEKGESIYWWYDVNLANKDFCNFLDFVGMQSGRFDFTYDAIDYITYKTKEKVTVKTGYSGTIDSSGNVSLSADYADVTIDVDNVYVSGMSPKNKGVIASIVYFKGIKFDAFKSEIQQLQADYPLYKEERAYGKFKTNSGKAKGTATAMIFSMIISLALAIFVMINGLFSSENKWPFIFYPLVGLIAFLKIIYVINYKKLDDIKSSGFSEGMPLVYVTFPLIALGVLTLGESLLLSPDGKDLVFLSYIGMIATAGLAVWHFIEYVFKGDCSSWISHYEEEDGPRKAFIKHGGADGYVKRVEKLQKYFVNKPIKGFTKNFFKKNAAKLNDIRAAQHKNYVKTGSHV